MTPALLVGEPAVSRTGRVAGADEEIEDEDEDENDE